MEKSIAFQEDFSLVDLQLRSLRIEDENTFRKAVHEFKQLESDFSFAFNYSDSLCFSNYVEMLKRWREGKDLPQEYVPNTFLVGIVENNIVGRVSIRHVLNDFLELYGGHIGFGVVPSQRNHGYASEMLKQAISEANSLGISKILITCDEGNIASTRVIEKNGGIFENTVIRTETDIPKRRYWVTIEEP